MRAKMLPATVSISKNPEVATTLDIGRATEHVEDFS